MAHWSSCAVHNAPALPVGPCDCGNDAPLTNRAAIVKGEKAVKPQTDKVPPTSNGR